MLSRKRKFCSQNEIGIPNYAILKLRPDTNCVQLFQYALSLGIVDVSFVSHPKEYFYSTSTSSDDTQSQSSDSQENGEQINTEATTAEASPSHDMSMMESYVQKEELLSDIQSEEKMLEEDKPIGPVEVTEMLNSIFRPNEMAALERAGFLETSHQVPQEPIMRSDSPAPAIPGSGMILCRLCGTNVSCRKVTNLAIHTLKTHCNVALWQCAAPECSFTHADNGRVRSHIRHQHSGQDLHPVDNRRPETVAEAMKSIRDCYPKVDWDDVHSNVLWLMDGGVKDREGTSGWEKKVVNSMNIDMPTHCNSCQFMVPLNKTAIEEHIRAVHKADQQFQCGACDYVNYEDLRVRLHITIRHGDKPWVPVVRTSVSQKPHLYVRRYFPQIMENLPMDELDQMIDALAIPMQTEAKENTEDYINAVQNIHNNVTNGTGGNVLDGDISVQTMMLMHMMPNFAMNTMTPSSISTPPQRKSSAVVGTYPRIDRLAGKIDCQMCQQQIESKRTALVSHAKSHCPQRQWQCPHCETSAAFHSKLKLHIVNAHKSDTEPLDHYSPNLENKWLALFRQCFPQYSQQCFVEEWKFRSKQQQHYNSHQEEALSKSLISVLENPLNQPRRAILVEENFKPEEVDCKKSEPSENGLSEITPQISEAANCTV